VLTTVGSVLYSIPNYLWAIMIVVFLGVQLGWLPITQMRGAYSPGVTPSLSLDFIRDAFFHASLPITTYVLSTIGSWMLIMKSSTLATLGEDYVTAARARGLKDRRIATAYVGRNAVLPLFSQLAIAAGFVVGGSILIEPIFQYQGIGFILKNSVNQRDYPMMQGIFLVITVAVVAANLLADLLYGRLDPRIRVTTEA
jgi:peptide/nickel transport system permease protein